MCATLARARGIENLAVNHGHTQLCKLATCSSRVPAAARHTCKLPTEARKSQQKPPKANDGQQKPPKTWKQFIFNNPQEIRWTRLRRCSLRWFVSFSAAFFSFSASFLAFIAFRLQLPWLSFLRVESALFHISSPAKRHRPSPATPQAPLRHRAELERASRKSLHRP